MRTRLRSIAGGAAVAIAAAAIAACSTPIGTPSDSSQIQLVSSTTLNGYQYDYYRDLAYPCSISGYQTFVIGTKVGSSTSTSAPLWAFMHGGGAGYFDASGNPIPNAKQKVEESATSLITYLENGGLVARVKADPAGFRFLSVSYCSHDVYAGSNTTDPNNPNRTPTGGLRPTTGLVSVKAAIEYVDEHYPTTAVFLHGTSAGSAGTFGVAWGLQQQGSPPTGIVADASIVNGEAMQAAFNAGVCTDDNDPARVGAIRARVAPELADPANEPDKLVASGRLTVPIMHIWNHGDVNTCGAVPISCPLRDGSVVTLGVTDCIHEPMRAAIAAQGPASASVNLPVCVDVDSTPDCSTHVVTTRPHATNTDPSTPADYLGAIMRWVDARLAAGTLPAT